MNTIQKFRIKGVHYDEFLGFLLRLLETSEASFTNSEDKAMVTSFRKAVHAYETAIKQKKLQARDTSSCGSKRTCCETVSRS